MATELATLRQHVTMVAPPEQCIICTDDLWKTYDMGSEQQVQALRGVNIQHSAQRVRRHHGTVRLRQIDADESDRLPRYAQQGQLLAQRPAGQRTR